MLGNDVTKVISEPRVVSLFCRLSRQGGGLQRLKLEFELSSMAFKIQEGVVDFGGDVGKETLR